MKSKRQPAGAPSTAVDSELRIIGGRFRGTRLAYHGDRVTRPMKHRVREAIFNLIGPAVKGKYAIDAFAGTGALGLEALSRGAKGATFIERHVPTAEIVRQNIQALGAEDCTELLVTSAFLWSKRDLPKGEGGTGKGESAAWVAFVSPPYDFFVERQEEIVSLVRAIIDHAPVGSLVVVESDQRFDFRLLPGSVKETRHDDGWDVRAYPPAVVGLWQCGEG